MSSYTWIKLYIDILDDPKVGQMPDWLKWRMLQLFLVAREVDRDGLLGPVPQLAWRLRIKEDDLIGSLRTMSEIGIVAETPDGWLVVNFKKRQTSESYDRVKRYRERYRNGQCNGEVAAGPSPSNSLSNSDSVSVEEEGVPGEEEPRALPGSPVEAMLHPDVRLFAAVTGGRIPGLLQYRAVIDAVRFLRGRERMDDQALAVYLAPYWLAWSSRKRLDGRPYDLGNITWLTEWALNGTIPAVGKDGASAKDKDAVIKEIAGRKNGRG